MENKIAWEKNLNTGLSRAQAGNKQILLFFHDPE